MARGHVFELLSGLIRKSLVNEDPEVDGRYRLLESMRAFARERLLDAGELQRTLRLHAEYYDALARRASDTFRNTPSREWMRGVAPDVDNLRAALEWTLDERGDVLLGASIVASAMSIFSSVTPAETVRMIRKALDALPPGAAPADRSSPEPRFDQSRRAPFLTAAVLRAAAERCRPRSTAASTINRRGLVEALLSLAEIVGWYFRDERELADALACESIEIARTLDDPVQLAFSLRTRGGLTIDISDFPQKRAVLEESLALMRRHGNEAQIVSTDADVDQRLRILGRRLAASRARRTDARRSASPRAPVPISSTHSAMCEPQYLRRWSSANGMSRATPSPGRSPRAARRANRSTSAFQCRPLQPSRPVPGGWTRMPRV